MPRLSLPSKKCKIAQTSLEKCSFAQNTCLNLPKSAKILCHFVQMCQRICPNLQEPCPNGGKILLKICISLSICYQENAQPALARKQSCIC